MRAALPSGQLVFSSATHTQGEMQDFALNRVRPLFATLPGVSAPPPFGGNQRTIVITLDPDKLRQYQISPEEAIAAVSKATLVMPSGNMWTGKIERIARTNAALGRQSCGAARARRSGRCSGTRFICATSAPSKTAPTSSPPTPTSTASELSTSPSPSAPTLRRSP